MLWCVLLLLLFFCGEVVSFFAGKFLQSHWLMYKIPQVEGHRGNGTFSEYMVTRDAILGWPESTEFENGTNDIRGTGERDGYSRFGSDDCVSIYGDSFALGAEVKRDKTWGARLAEYTGCSVGIYGVNGYGSDQAYLRFQGRVNDRASVVILTHLSENITRNLMRLRDLYSGYAKYGFKPRFVLEQEKLTLVKIPVLSEDEYWRYVALRQPQLVLEHENFHVDGPAGEVALKFPYSISVLRNMLSYRMRSALHRSPDYHQFYDRDHPMQGLQISAAILDGFYRDALKRNQKPLIILLPTRHDLAIYEETGEWTYKNLIHDLTKAGVPFLEFGDHLIENTVGIDRQSLYMPLGHMGEQASKILADFVFAHIEEELRVASSPRDSKKTERTTVGI